MGIKLDAAKKKDIDQSLAKEILKESLETLTYSFGDGRVIQTRPKDQQNLQGKIEVINAGGSSQFIMADNVVHPVTVEELQTALSSGMLAASALWDDYMAIVQS